MANTPTPAKPRVRVSPMTALDAPSAAECELLAFNTFDGADADALTVTVGLHPTRPAQYASGAPPREWADFPSTVQRIERDLASASALFYKGEVEVAPGDWRVAGMIWIGPPDSAQSHRAEGHSVVPAANPAKQPPQDDSINWEFLFAFKDAVKKDRRELLQDQLHFSIEMLVVRPDYQRRGVGKALLNQCAALADEAGVPIAVEASKAATPVYASVGFKTVRESEMAYKEKVVKWPVLVRDGARETVVKAATTA